MGGGRWTIGIRYYPRVCFGIVNVNNFFFIFIFISFSRYIFIFQYLFLCAGSSSAASPRPVSSPSLAIRPIQAFYY